jgi:ATP-dependent protease ClpP protease subunit
MSRRAARKTVPGARPAFAARVPLAAVRNRTAPDAPGRPAPALVTEAPRQFWQAKAAATEDDADELWIYDEIGFSWFDEGVTAAGFAKDLAALKGKRLTLRVNSPGGDVFDGLAIKNLIANHPAHVTARVDALAASIASVIIQGADEVIVEPHAQIMIHDASGVSFGNADEMREMADLLDMISDNIAQVYADAAGGTSGDWRKVMKGEKWYTGDEAVTAGLADRVGDAGTSRKTRACPDCDGSDPNCATCDGTGRVSGDGAPDQDEDKAKARERLRVAASWCRQLFPGHESRFENVLAELADGQTPPEDGDADPAAGSVEDDAPGVDTDPALPAPAAQGEGEPVPDTPRAPAPPEGEPEQLAFAWDASLLTGAVQAAVAPPRIDLGDWRAWFSEAPAAREPERNLPVDIGPPPERPVEPETPRNALAELIGSAVRLAANDQPAPDAPSAPEPELPALPPIRLDVADVRRAVREARY